MHREHTEHVYAPLRREAGLALELAEDLAAGFDMR
jgi:hypothetical protein